MKFSDLIFRSFSMLFFTIQFGRQNDIMKKTIFLDFFLWKKLRNNFYYYNFHNYNQIKVKKIRFFVNKIFRKSACGSSSAGLRRWEYPKKHRIFTAAGLQTSLQFYRYQPKPVLGKNSRETTMYRPAAHEWGNDWRSKISRYIKFWTNKLKSLVNEN